MEVKLLFWWNVRAVGWGHFHYFQKRQRCTSSIWDSVFFLGSCPKLGSDAHLFKVLGSIVVGLLCALAAEKALDDVSKGQQKLYRYCRYLEWSNFPQKIGDPGDSWSYWIHESIPSKAGNLFSEIYSEQVNKKTYPSVRTGVLPMLGTSDASFSMGWKVKVRRIPATWSSWWSFLVGVHSKYPPEIQTPIPKNIVWIVWNIAILSLHFRLSIGFLIASFFPTVARLCQQEDPHLPLRCNGAYHHLQCLLSLYDAWLCH